VAAAAVWWIVPATQMAMALVTLGPASGRTMSFGRALDLWFAGHLPYTAWLLLLPVVTRLSQLARFDFVVITLAAAVLWAAFIETAYFRVVLNASPSSSRAHVVVHTALMLTVVAAAVCWSAGGVAPTIASLVRIAAHFVR